MECRFARLDGDEDNAHNFWNLLDKPLREAIRYMFVSSSEQDDLVQEAVEAIFKKIGFFDPERSSFIAWSKMQACSAKAHYLRNKGYYSRTMAGQIKLIREAIGNLFPNGPKPDQTWLELARDHVERVANLSKLSNDMVLNALTAWGMADASESLDYLKINDPKDEFQSQREMEVLELAMSHLPPRSRTILFQKYVCGLNNDEIAEKFNITQDNSRQILSKAVRSLRDILNEIHKK